MVGLNKFGRQRLAYLENKKPGILKELKDDGILEKHLLHAQKRAIWQLDQLVMAGMEELDAEEIVLREVIQK